MAREGIQHVYILGAGFSVPLGGPLFKQLLTIEMSNRFQVELGREEDSPHMKFFRAIPRILSDIFGNEDSYPINAEEILELLEPRKSGKQSWLFSEFLKKCTFSHKDLFTLDATDSDRRRLIHNTLKARLAYETNWFLGQIQDESERWLPYREWCQTLTDSDTVITTNYDLAFESLDPNFKSDWDKSAPRQLLIEQGNFNQRILKLHGSCDWLIGNDNVPYRQSFRTIHDLLGRNLIIGSPGVMKSQLATGVLKEVWKKAEEKLLDADVISIVGYSLPETDNLLRMKILDCIAKSGKLQAVNIVLGMRNERGLRAQEIIQNTIPSTVFAKVISNGCYKQTDVILRNMYAQDYLPMANRLAKSIVL